mgnify:CR=1 FL=1
MFALMKKIKFVILFCFYLGFFSFSIGATPSNVRFSAYAVEDYSNYTGTKNLARSISHKNKFLNKLIVAIQKNTQMFRRKFYIIEKIRKRRVPLLNWTKRTRPKLYSLPVMEISKVWLFMINH